MINDKFIGPASDLWALGILTYKLFVGHVPFNADDEIELFNKICNQEIEFPQVYSSLMRVYHSKYKISSIN